jgi:hypothetical protein
MPKKRGLFERAGRRLDRIFNEAGNELNNAMESLLDLFHKAEEDAGHETVDELTYEDTIRWFIQHKKDAAASQKGVLQKEMNKDGTVMVYSAFADAQNKPVSKENGEMLCRAVLANKLDDELIEMFEGQDFVEIAFGKGGK